LRSTWPRKATVWRGAHRTDTVHDVPGTIGRGGAQLSIVVVTHNNSDLIGRCLDAIVDASRRYSYELFVVDNASSDDTREILAGRGWTLETIALEQNVGFAKAVNCALARARGKYVALVNSDAFPDPGCIDELIDVLERDRHVGIVGAQLRYPSGELQPSAANFPSLLGGLWVALFLHRIPPFSWSGFGYYADARLYRRGRRVDWVSAAVCAARAEVGPLPVSSFMYGEDVRWARACQDAGLEVWLEPRATAVHIGRASTEKSQDAGFAQRQRVEFELSWFAPRGRAAVLGARVVLVIHALARLLVNGALALSRARGNRSVAEYRALLLAALSTPTPKR
jgi:GT2 family glycosyltransferase